MASDKTYIANERYDDVVKENVYTNRILNKTK